MKYITEVNFSNSDYNDGVKYIIESHGVNYEVLFGVKRYGGDSPTYTFKNVNVGRDFTVSSSRSPFTSIVLAVQFAMFIEARKKLEVKQ
jgi:hypothetical protein